MRIREREGKRAPFALPTPGIGSRQARLEEALKLIAALQAQIDKLTRPPKTPDKTRRQGPRKGSLDRDGGGGVVAKPSRCRSCQAVFADADHRLDGRYDRIELSQPRRCCMDPVAGAASRADVGGVKSRRPIKEATLCGRVVVPAS